MGANASSSISKNIAEATTQIMNSYVNQCGTAVNSEEQWNIVGCSGVTIKNNDYSNIVVYDPECLQSISNNEDVNTAIAQTVQQLAQAESQNIGWPSVDVASTYSAQVTKISSSIVQQYMNQCSAAITANSQFNCTNSSNIVFQGNSFEDRINDSAKCTQQIIDSLNVSNQITQATKQTSTAKQQDAVFILLLLLLLPLIFIFIFVTMNGKWIIIMLIFVIIVLLIIYLVLAKERGWVPFQNK